MTFHGNTVFPYALVAGDGLLPRDLTERCGGQVLLRIDPGPDAPSRDLLR